MRDSQLNKTLSQILRGYSRKDNLKELCICLGSAGDLTIGGRTMLISEITEEQPFEELAGCIQVIFAASSDRMSFDTNNHKPELVDELQHYLRTEETARKSLAEFSVENLVNVLPKLEKVTFEDKW